LRSELKRITEERDILKKRLPHTLPESPSEVCFSPGTSKRVRNSFHVPHDAGASQRLLCLDQKPKSVRQRQDEWMLGLIKQFWLESGCVYGYRKIHQYLRKSGENCGKNREARLMRQAGIKAQVGYRKPRYKGGRLAVLATNHLNQEFEAQAPNQIWITDITYIRTYEGWLYLAVVIDLFSRQIVGWSMQPKIHTDLVLNALVMAVWRRKPKEEVLVHSDQGSQYTSLDWQNFLKSHNLACSMSRRGNCYDNAVAESFFQLLKRERIKRKIYKNREEARQDIFHCIEMFYNPVRRHGNNSDLWPVEFEKRYSVKMGSV